MHLYYFMEGTNSKITTFTHFQEHHRNLKLFRVFLVVCKNLFGHHGKATCSFLI